MLYFILAFTISIVISLFIIYYSHKHEIFIDCNESDKPQRFHEVATPRSGGIGIIGGFILLLFSVFGIKLLIPTILAFISGIFEDFNNSLSARTRLILQAIAAVFGIYLLNAIILYLGLGIHLPLWFGYLFTIFVIVGLMNAINIIDGFNGLASGITIVIIISFGYIAYIQDNQELLKVIYIVLGSIFGFFLLVFPKGKIFLGDGGAYLLGFIVAIVGIFLANKYSSVSPWYVLAVLIYPVWEVAFSIVRKLSIGLSPLEPDGYHLHMLVYKHLVKSNPMASLFIVVLTIPFTLYATIHAHNSFLNIKISIAFIVTYTLLYLYLYKKSKLEETK